MSANTVVARAYNTFRVEPFGLIRKSSSTQRLADEISYYKTIQRDISKSMFFPRIIASHISKNDSDNWLLMEHYGYENLGQFLTGRCRSAINWYDMYDSLTPILSQFETFTDPQGANELSILDMIEHKTNREFAALFKSRPDLQPMFNSPALVVNGEILLNFMTIAQDVFTYVKDNMLKYNSTMIHGDMCFSNILYSPDDRIFKFIDPRGSFGTPGIFGDVRYDIAKLYHSVDGGYEFIINDLFNVVCEDGNWSTHIHYNNYRTQALNEFERRFFDTGAFSKKEIKIIQGCIYIGMCARHYDSAARQEIMYLTGIRLLNEAMEL